MTGFAMTWWAVQDERSESCWMMERAVPDDGMESFGMMERDFAKCCRSMSFRRLSKEALVDNVALGWPRCRDMPFPTHFCAACLDSVLRDASSERFEYTYAIIYSHHRQGFVKP